MLTLYSILLVLLHLLNNRCGSQPHSISALCGRVLQLHGRRCRRRVGGGWDFGGEGSGVWLRTRASETPQPAQIQGGTPGTSCYCTELSSSHAICGNLFYVYNFRNCCSFCYSFEIFFDYCHGMIFKLHLLLYTR